MCCTAAAFFLSIKFRLVRIWDTETVRGSDGGLQEYTEDAPIESNGLRSSDHSGLGGRLLYDQMFWVAVWLHRDIAVEYHAGTE